MRKTLPLVVASVPTYLLAFLLALFTQYGAVAQTGTGPGGDECPGCTDPAACNFDPQASTDDGSCQYLDCVVIAQNDVLSINLGDPINYNVLTNDVNLGIPVQLIILSDDPCFYLDSEGNLQSNPYATDCCGFHSLSYMLCSSDGNGSCDPAHVCIDVVCPKPDCTLIDLSDYIFDDALGNGGQPGCISVCSNSVSTVFLPYSANNTYTWNVIGGSNVQGANAAEQIITWGAAGAGNISVTVLNINTGIATNYSFCVDIMPSPVASFTGPVYACIMGSLCFDASATTNADAYFWDFGDGNTDSGGPIKCHTYNTSGNFTVTLTAINYNYDAQGNPLCCCTDTTSLDIFIDPLPGPNIYCISTLCEGDSSCYWTDATNCGTYTWLVYDALGNPIIPTSGLGTDTICVQWGTGPFGTISLEVSGCDSAYCNNPTTVTIPIISSVSQISGPIVVCEGATETYSVPKWMSTLYLWQVTGATSVIDDSTHTITVTWGPAGTGTIHVDYFSSFLAGLPGHDFPDCYGHADLTVSILPEFNVTVYGPTLTCVGSTTTVAALSNIVYTNYDWTITPSVPFTGDFTDQINITWPGTGTYIITASPVNAGIFCNTIETVVVTVMEQDPADAITGPIEVCPGDTTYYNAVTSDIGVTYYWTAQNGTPLSPNSQTTAVAWGPTGPYSVSVALQMGFNPYCLSDTINLPVYQIGIIGSPVITGTAACTNSLSSYTLSPTQHPSATIVWSTFPSTYGSVVGGQGTYNATVQWNNDQGPVTVIADITVCGVTTQVILNQNIFTPIVPVITQVGYLCPGVNITLQTTGGFINYLWSNGATTSSTTVGMAGLHSVTTTDANGCVATGYTTVTPVPGPIAAISSGDDPIICLSNPHPVTLVAQTNACYEFEWFCNGVSQGPSSPVSTFLHPFHNIAGSYSYVVKVTDTCTGCQNTSLPFIVTESPCAGGGCNPEPYTLAISYSTALPNCNIINFAMVGTNTTVSSWDFGDGFNSGAAAPSHTYLSAGCYNVTLYATVPEVGNPGSYCVVETDTAVCIPLAVDFTSTIIHCDTVQFNELSTWIAGPGNPTSSYLWNFGFTTSTLANPVIVFPGGGVYPVTLTVFNTNGCQATITHNVTIGSVAIPIVTAVPNTTWVGFPVNFSASAPGAISYFWDFKDGATFTGPNPQHSYNTANTYWVTATASDVNGCQKTDSVLVTIYPAIPPSVITSPDLTICAGQTTTLTAPAGYTYLWSNGATTQTITVGPGIYSVLLTDANGCPLLLDPVEVISLPLPSVALDGDQFICDAGCVNLSAPYVFPNTYQWIDNTGAPIPGAIYNTLSVCDNNILPGYAVIVTDANGCTDTSVVVTVTLAVSPSFTIIASGTSCAGSPTTLNVSPVQTGVVYNWSNGDTGPTSVVTLAGTYTVFGTDTVSGCSSSASHTIHPLPDLCIVPAGCYEACNPDTICGPNGLASYQWNYNGGPISGANSQCLVVTQSGTYSLTGTNSFGCSTTSGDLVLMLINCDGDPCDSLSIDFEYLADATNDVDSCCVSLSYTNNYGPIIGFTISTTDADFNVDLGSLDPALNFQSVTAQNIAINSSTPGGNIPSGTLNDFLHFCVTNTVNSPQQIIINWYDSEASIICADTIEINCPVEPDCLYLASDSIYCDGSNVLYQLTVCNPIDATHSIGYINITPTSPPGIVLTPPAIIPGTPIAPGTCQTFTIQLSGPGIEGQTFCYGLVAHEFDPAVVDTSYCCSTGEEYCIDIPYCDPCALVWIENVDTLNVDDCCYNISIYNGYSATYFDEIGVNVITPVTTVTVNNPFGSGWTTSGYTPTSFSLIPGPIFGNAVPLGLVTLPEICVQTNAAPPQQIEITWMHDGVVVCRDTLEVSCEPDCGYLLYDAPICDPATGTWVYSGYIKNTSNFVMSEAHFTFTSPAGLGAYNTVVYMGPLAPGSVYGPFSIPIGAPAMSGDTVCFIVTLHEVTPDGLFLSCCNFNHCIVLPDCAQDVDCACGPAFTEAVLMGINCIPTALSSTWKFAMQNIGFFGDCDQLIWRFYDGSPNVTSFGGDTITHTFLTTGTQQLCVRVSRTATDGTLCTAKVCKTITILAPPLASMTLYPNPNNGLFYISMDKDLNVPITVTVLDNLQRPLHGILVDQLSGEGRISIDLTQQAKGVYYIQLQVGDDRVVKKAIVY